MSGGNEMEENPHAAPRATLFAVRADGPLIIAIDSRVDQIRESSQRSDRLASPALSRWEEVFKYFGANTAKHNSASSVTQPLAEFGYRVDGPRAERSHTVEVEQDLTVQRQCLRQLQEILS